MITKHEALDILDKLEFFQGQRAGRELWFEKNSQLQDIDIACFVRDISNLREYIQTADVALKAEVAREIFEEIENALESRYDEDERAYYPVPHYDLWLGDDIAELKKKYTEEKK